VIAQRLDGSGNVAGPAITVEGPVTASQGKTPVVSPRVAMDDDGDFVVTWTEYDSSNKVHLYARRYDASSTPMGRRSTSINAPSKVGPDR
jgi:hypothetical protein